jgi:hypothetical protein
MARDAQGNPVVRSLGDFAGEATAGFNPVTILDSLGQAFVHPIDTATNVLAGQDRLRLKALEAFKGGDYVSGARHLLEWAIPLYGQRLGQAGDYMQQGETAKGLGATADLGLQMVLPHLVSGAVGVTNRVTNRALGMLPRVEVGGTAAEQAAVRFGQSRSVPMDAATISGNRHLANIQKRLGATLGGSAPIEASHAASAAGLERVAGDLAQDIRPVSATPVSAGEAVQKALTTRIQQFHGQANAAYDQLRQFEQAQAQRIATVPGGAIESPPGARMAFTKTPLAVDVGTAKTALRPLYERLAREAELTPGAVMGDKARTLQALDRLMQAPDLAPLSQVDAVLGDLKALARGADMPELRTAGQGGAAQIVKQLDSEVKAAALRGGPDVLKALEQGRAATVAKYRTAEVRDLLSAEPAQVYRQLTANADTALEKLRAVQREAPQELPTLGRAYLDRMIETATPEGSFAHTDKLFADWHRLGDETKAILFGPAATKDLDNFFLLAKKIGTNPNPSGTASVLHALDKNQLAAYPVTKLAAQLLTTPGGVKALTSGIRLAMSPTPAAQAMGLAQIARLAQTAGGPTGAAAGPPPSGR